MLILVASWLMGSCGRSVSGPELESRLIEAGKSLKRPLHAGEIHRYHFEARLGDLVHVTVDQRAIDVVVELWDETTGRRLAIDSRNGATGPEEGWWIPEGSGRVWIEIHAWRQGSPGEYELRFVQRPTRSGDRDLVGALEHQQQAQSYRDLARSDAATHCHARAARDELLMALELWRGTDQSYQEGLVWFLLGDLAWRDAQAAIENYRRALELFQQLGERGLMIDVLFKLGRTFRLQGDFAEAGSCQRQALLLALAAADRPREAIAVNNVALLQKIEGNLLGALKLFQRSLDLYDEFHLEDGKAAVYLNLGQVYGLLGRRRESFEYLDQAHGLARALGNTNILAQSLGEIGSIKLYEEHVEEARSCLEEGIDVAGQPDSSYTEASLRRRLGKLELELLDLDAAEHHYQAALAAFELWGYSRDVAHTRLSLADLHLARGNRPAALVAAQRAMEFFENSTDREGEMFGNYFLALAVSEVDGEEALRRFRKALEILESMRRDLAGGSLRLQFYDLRHEVSEAFEAWLLARHRTLPEGGFEAEAFLVGETVRARGLLEVLSVTYDAEPPPGLEILSQQVNAAEWARLESAQGFGGGSGSEVKLQRLMEAYAQAEASFWDERRGALKAREVDLVSLENVQRDLLDAETTLLIYSLGEEHGFLWVIDQDEVQPVAVSGRRDLEPLIEALAGELAEGFRREAELKVEALLEELGARLLGPVQDHLQNQRLVIVADDGVHKVPFAALPHPLYGGSLIEHHELIRLPSPSVLHRLRKREAARSLPPTSLAIVADPVFETDDVRLRSVGDVSASVEGSRSAGVEDLANASRNSGVGEPTRLRATRDEADAIVAQAGELDTKIVSGFEANRDWVTSGALADYDLIHFATHAFVHDRHPELSGLILSLVDEEGQPRDGFLRAHEISRLELSASLVVLSACKTAVGPRVHAEGPSSLARSFLNAGATRVVVSLWSVDDEATAELMRYFYRGLLIDGRRPAAALRSAQRVLRGQSRYRHPYFWAGFELQGDWR